MTSPNFFDAVIMLTWSDWKTEPISNRYHYATRFARTVPVLFMQNQFVVYDGLSIERTEIQNLDLVNVSVGLNDREIADFKQLLHARGIRRPLIWIYDSMSYQPLLDALPAAFRVYHATEDYLTQSDCWAGEWSAGKELIAKSVLRSAGKELIAKSVLRVLEQVDFMVACTDGVAKSYLTTGKYRGQYAVIENGCDAEYFIEHAQRVEHTNTAVARPVAIFQGGINGRLDYHLMYALIQRMPAWDFWFCGYSVESNEWSLILKLPNVKYYGELELKEFAQLMCNSTVGIITYLQDQWIRNSLPLKAYEYVACGLPVVTVPITALECDPDLFTIASTPAEFESALLNAEKSRFDPFLLQRRREVALTKSYNGRFDLMCQNLQDSLIEKNPQEKKLKMAILYDSANAMHISTIQQHLDAFSKYSKHDFTYIPGTSQFWNLSPEHMQCVVDFSYFDVVVVHYSIRMSIRGHLDKGLARSLEKFNGFKVLFIQDEYEETEIARQHIAKLCFNLVYTCVPESGREYVYPSYRFPGTEFLPTLTGYIPENSSIEQFAQPLDERKLFIAYRGRKLPAIYGNLGYEKYRIGIEMKKLTEALNITSDIEVDDSKRIYGTDWYKFLGSARATLGTESGASVFDFDGSLKAAIAKLEAKNTEISFEEISAKVLAPYEGRVHMNQVSPKIFESICLRTVLVLFEGTYSNVILPGVHFISLKKDFSNVEEIINKLQDVDFVRQMTEQAYVDIVLSGKYSYHTFIKSFDASVEARVMRGNHYERLNGPLYFRDNDGRPRQALPAMPSNLLLEKKGVHWQLKDFNVGVDEQGNYVAFLSQIPGREIFKKTSFIYLTLKKIWRLLPFAFRIKLVKDMGKMLRLNKSASKPKSLLFRAAHKAWHTLPIGVRKRLLRILRGG